MSMSTTGLGRGVRRSMGLLPRSDRFLRGMMLLNFFVKRVSAQAGVVFHLLHALGLKFLVSGAHVARGRLVFLARFGAFQRDDFAGHSGLVLYLDFLGSESTSGTAALLAPAPSIVPRLPSLRR